VESISWGDAEQFCARLSEFLKKRVRLPTEAEWEYACRAGTRTRFNSGDTELDLTKVAWFGNPMTGQSHPVGRKQPNAWGLYDMHGNVWEYVADFYGPYPKQAATDPKGPAKGESRVVRGGSFGSDAAGCRSAVRFQLDPQAGFFDYGFRVVVEVE
jgi:formylglycine-generating enzyme required for sulfatase activity